MREHTWEKHENCNNWSCPICVGGLRFCTTCKGGEGSLTTECCGRPITEEEEHKIYKLGTLDFIDGEWRPK